MDFEDTRWVPPHDVKLLRLMDLIQKGFSPFEDIPLSWPDEPSAVSGPPMFFLRAGEQDMTIPDRKLVMELLAAGHLSWSIEPHPKQKNLKRRVFALKSKVT
jgi:hypothetical protein